MNRNPSSYRAVGEYRAAVSRITEPTKSINFGCRHITW